MMRYPYQNPAASDMVIQRCTIFDPQEAEEWRRTVSPNPPPGFRNFVRWVGGDLHIGMEPIDAVQHATEKGDDFEAMSEADLKTQCGLSGIKYGPDSTLSDIRARLRAKKGKKP